MNTEPSSSPKGKKADNISFHPDYIFCNGENKKNLKVGKIKTTEALLTFECGRAENIKKLGEEWG